MKKYFKKNYFSYNTGETIKLENEECNEIGYIIKGKVIIKNYFYNGHESIIRILESDEIFGLNLIFSNAPNYRGTIEALENTQIAFLNKKELLETMRNNFDLTLFILNKISSDFQYFNTIIKIMSQKKIEGKICLALKYFNKSLDKNYLELQFSIKHLSKIIQVNRSSLFRSLANLEKKKIIKRNKKHIYILDIEQFYNLIE